MKRKERLTLLLLLIYLAAFAPTILAQSIQKEKMANLSFMVGEWVGNSTTYKEGSATTIPAYEKISYKVDSHLITIDLKSESLMLHTVIYYNEEEQTFYYCPFYKKGAGKYKGSFKDGKCLVKFGKNVESRCPAPDFRHSLMWERVSFNFGQYRVMSHKRQFNFWHFTIIIFIGVRQSIMPHKSMQYF